MDNIPFVHSKSTILPYVLDVPKLSDIRETANIFAGLGFSGLFFCRLDYRDKAKRKEEQRMEFVWQVTITSGSSSGSYILL